MNILHINKINFDQTSLLHSSTCYSPVVPYSVTTVLLVSLYITDIIKFTSNYILLKYVGIHMHTKYQCHRLILEAWISYVRNTGSDPICVGVVVMCVVLACLLTVIVFNWWDIQSGGISNGTEKAFLLINV
jgi:hypothetical protein